MNIKHCKTKQNKYKNLPVYPYDALLIVLSTINTMAV